MHDTEEVTHVLRPVNRFVYFSPSFRLKLAGEVDFSYLNPVQGGFGRQVQWYNAYGPLDQLSVTEWAPKTVRGCAPPAVENNFILAIGDADAQQ